MNRSHLVLVLTACLMLTGYWLLTPGRAEPAAPPAGVSLVGVVNVPELFRDAKETKLLNDEFKKRSEQFTKDAEDQQKTLTAKEADIRKKYDPAGADYKDRMNELQAAKIRFGVWRTEQQNTMLIEHQDRTAAFYAKIDKAVTDIAREGGIDVVLFREEPNLKSARNAEDLLGMIRDRKVIYSSTRADLTPKVRERLDAELDKAK